MRTNIFFMLLGFCGLLSINCATTSAPNKWLPEKTDADKQAFGGWATVETKTERIIRGELIAVGDSGLYVMLGETTVFVGVDSVKKVKIGKYEDANRVAAWGMTGTASTITHGFGLIISAPIWILGSTVLASDYASQKILEYPDSSLLSLRLYARFPQGLPTTLNLKDLKPKFPLGKSGENRDEITNIKKDILNSPFEIRFNSSILLSSTHKFSETLISANYDVKDWFYIGAGISRNKYEIPADILNNSVPFEEKKENFSPFFEVGKNFKVGTFNPYINGSIYMDWFDNGFTNDKTMYAVSVGANTLLGTMPIALQTEIKCVFISEKPPFLERQYLNPILLNIGMVYYF